MAEPKLPTSKAPVPGNANDFIEQQLDARLRQVETLFIGDAFTFSGPLTFGVDDLIRSVMEKIGAKKTRQNRLIFILTTDGGYIEVVHRIVDTLRKHYSPVEFIVPNYAYSAGTILAMSGDAIYMDYYSRLGPIDPQVDTGGKTVPALGYLEMYNRLIQKAQKGTITAAEVGLLINGFDQAELYQYEQQRALSIRLLQDWLVKYKFKNWKITQTQQKSVTLAMKKKRAAEIASKLNDTKRWHSHGYGISKDVC
jgi:membrane-bound ClpP family serine protease